MAKKIFLPRVTHNRPTSLLQRIRDRGIPSTRTRRAARQERERQAQRAEADDQAGREAAEKVERNEVTEDGQVSDGGNVHVNGGANEPSVSQTTADSQRTGVAGDNDAEDVEMTDEKPVEKEEGSEEQ